MNIPSLKKVFNDKFKIGNILAVKDLDNAETLENFCYHYNAVTAENCMKPVEITKAQGAYDFSHADKLVDFAQKNDIALIAHTLIWHGQSAPWLNKNADNTPLTRVEAKKNMEEYIRTYAGRYKERVHSWDVINEAFRDINEFSGSWRNDLRQQESKDHTTSYWFLAYANGADASKGEKGEDFVFDAFYFTRKYDPHAILYYNDYNEDVPAKRDAIAQMVEEINQQWRAHPEYDNRLLIEGIGMQAHFNHVHFNLDNVRAALARYTKTGVKISITELDFTYGSSEAPAVPLTEEQATTQASHYRALFSLYAEYAKQIERVSFWAKNDGESWRKWGSPVLFDADGNAKPAFHAIIE